MKQRLDFAKVPSLVYLLVVTIYFISIVLIDNSNLTTTNGLYKSVSAQGWANGDRFDIDSGGLLYLPLMGLFCKFIPDSWVNFYGYTTDFVAYRKLAFVNGLFGAAASTVVYLLSLAITKNKLWSFGTALFHAVLGFVFVNSIISEDIIPAYFFYILSVYSFYKGMISPNKRVFFSLATISVFAMLTLHWSLFPVAVAGYGVATVLLIKHDRKYLRLFIEQLIFFLTLVFILKIIGKPFNLTMFKILLPEKANSSWVGWSIEKFSLLFLGVGNYLLGGRRMFLIRDIDNFISVIYIAISWLAIIASVLVIIKSFFKTAKFENKIFSAIIITVFIIGEIENLYGSADDPQMQVQPLFIITYGLILLSRKNISTLPIILALVIGLNNFSYNYIMFRNQDSNYVKNYKIFKQKYKPDQVKLIGLYEDFITWLWVFDYKGNWDNLFKDIILYQNFVNNNQMASGKEIADLVSLDIEKALNENKTVLAITPWIDRDFIYLLKAQNLYAEQATELINELLKKYKIKRVENYFSKDFAVLERR